MFLFKQKTADVMRISDWSSDVCSSDLGIDLAAVEFAALVGIAEDIVGGGDFLEAVGRRVIARIAVGMQFLGQLAIGLAHVFMTRAASSDERRLGNECVSTGRSRWAP